MTANGEPDYVLTVLYLLPEQTLRDVLETAAGTFMDRGRIFSAPQIPICTYKNYYYTNNWKSQSQRKNGTRLPVLGCSNEKTGLPTGP